MVRLCLGAGMDQLQGIHSLSAYVRVACKHYHPWRWCPISWLHILITDCVVRLVPRRGAGPELRSSGREIDEYLMRLLNAGSVDPSQDVVFHNLASHSPLHGSFPEDSIGDLKGPLEFAAWNLDVQPGLKICMLLLECHWPSLCLLEHCKNARPHADFSCVP